MLVNTLASDQGMVVLQLPLKCSMTLHQR